MKQKIGMILGPVVAVGILLFSDLDPGHPLVTRCASVASLMAIWWITEALPIPATALIPVALFPLFGIMKGSAVAGQYFNHIIFLFIGGFIVALAMEKWKLHERIALITILLIGSGARRIIFGFMLATFVMSMWVSNTATTMMMTPMALAIILQLRQVTAPDNRGNVNRFSVALLLGIAYSASIGGLATLIGTPPNLVLMRQMKIMFPDTPEIGFGQWMLFALPLAIILLFICWWLLTKMFLGGKSALAVDLQMFRKDFKELGAMRYQEWVVFISFVVMAALWIFRKPLDFGIWTIPGWSALLPEPDFVDDGVVAISVALALFLIPARTTKGERIMDWRTATNINWGIVLLFGGGFALAAGFVNSGLSEWMGTRLTGFAGAPQGVFVGAASFLMMVLTELTSNTASTQMILPVLGVFAEANHLAPLLLMIPATLSASCAFMLPVATPPNAIVFGTGELKMSDMIKAGIIMNFIGITLIVVFIFTLGASVFALE